MKQIEVLSVYMFGQNVGFVNLQVDAYLNGKRLPGFVFLRGDAVAVLLLVNQKMILTQQFRVPMGRFCLEAPAGMLDESAHFAGVAAKEIEEECGITISQDEMVYLQEVLTSPGGSDEVIHLFAVEKDLPEEELKRISEMIHGHEDEGEQIRLVIQEFTWENVLKTQDAKLISAAASYFQHKQNLKVPKL